MVSSYPPNIGGESTYTYSYVTALQNYLQDEISEIHVLSHREGEEQYKPNNDQNSKVRVYRLFDSSNWIKKNFAFLKIFLAIRRIRPEVVHFEYSPLPKGKYGGLIGEPLLVLFLLLRLSRTPFFVTLHSIWLPEQAKARLTELTKNGFLTKVAWVYFKFVTHFLGTMPRKLFLLVAIKDSTITDSFSKTYHIPHERLKEELHGIWWYANEEFYKTQENKRRSRRIVCLGVIRPSKGYEYTIEAMRTVIKKIPDSSLLIAGKSISDEGRRYINQLRTLVSTYSLGNAVTIEERYLSDDEFSQYVKSAGVIVLPYTRVVGASSILSVALSYRVPVILANSGPFFEKLSDILPVVPSLDDKVLAKEIIMILESEEYYATLVNKYKEYSSEHDWSIVVRNIYAEFMKSK